ncbi:G patch domain and ankyrin repeat-containing protein 1 homolog [Saccostrea echinata]|uniref:G patch domain and ankyrin repeat-containing protein 1 homolog n=1 Tax=Saccostrea echinata TaxID=191078 RepID=UPI002A819835|nr:G patch domain and ankyrin repeat-containing protein 1 homolog [Saccostrea echinata]
MAKMVLFVPESTEKESNSTGQSQKTSSDITGSEARQFYEDLVNESHSKDGSILHQGIPHAQSHAKHYNDRLLNNVPKTSSASALTVKESDFLKAAQNGDIKIVKKCLKQGIEIDCIDSYGWTALMCASHSGNRQVVTYLLKKGINRYVVDRKRRDAVVIARRTGHESLANFISTFDSSIVRAKQIEKQEAEVVEFFCDVCNETIHQIGGENHETSTVHLFNRQLKPKPDSFLIPPGNIGFQLMLKNGWDGEKGLGSRGQGQRYPVKTILKRDRYCLGGESERTTKKKAKVTHFGPHDKNAVGKLKERKLRSSTINKQQKKKEESKSQWWERNLREEMNDFF